MATKSISISVGSREAKPDHEGRLDTDHEKLTNWKNEPSVKSLSEDFQAAKPAHDRAATKIKHWLNQIRIEGDAKPRVFGKNRSQIQPKLIRRQGEWRYSALTESFLSSEKLYQVEPRTWEDEDSAVQNELVINYQFNTKMDKVDFIDEYVRTSYDEGTVFVKVGWFRKTHEEEVEEPVYEYYTVTTEEELQTLQQAAQMRQENPRGFKEQVPPEVQAALLYSEEIGQPCMARDTGETELVKKTIVDENCPTLEILDYNNFYFDPSCNGNLKKAKFGIISFETSKAELKEDGRYKNLDKVNFSGNTPLSVPDHATSTPDTFNFNDEVRKRVVAYEYWGFYDIHGNGELVPIVATWIGNVMIRMEENPFPDKRIPVVAVKYMPVRKSVHGETDAELLEDNQAIIGAISRGLIDSMARTANGQRGMAKNMLDVVNRRKFEMGEDYEYNPNGPNPQNSVIEHKFGEVSQSALAILEMQNQEAESLTGVKAFTGGLSSDAYGKVATGIKGMLDAASKREMGILRRLAAGMVEIGKKIIAMNAVFLSEEEVIRVTNQEYVTIRREDLRGNFDLVVDISTPEVDEAKAQDLNFMLQTNGNNMDVNMRNMILAEISKLKRMPKLAHAIKNYKPEPDPMQVAMVKTQLEALQLDNALKQAEIQRMEYENMETQTKAMLNQAKAREAGSNADLKDLDFVEQETGTKHARELDKTTAQAKANQNLKVTEALLKPKKEGEKDGDIGKAIAYNRITDAIDNPLNN